MECKKSAGSVVLVTWVLASLLLQATTLCLAWNTDGHDVICNLARVSSSSAEAIHTHVPHCLFPVPLWSRIPLSFRYSFSFGIFL